MKLLLIDTCGTTGSIALAETENSEVLVTASLPGRTASERLVATIKSLFADRNESLQSLGAIVVVHGPGSFTGVRIGVSAAKGLCEALALPLIAISRLAVLAEQASPVSPRVYALLDAGRNEFYFGEYADGISLRESLLTRDEVQSAIAQGQTVVACEPAVMESLASLAPQLVSELTAENALPLALRRLREATFDDVVTLDANYVRRSDAEIFAKPKPPETSGQ